MSAKNVFIKVGSDIVASAGFINWIQGSGTTYTVAVDYQTDYITVTDEAAGSAGEPTADAHIADTDDAHDATAISYSGSVEAANVNSAIDALNTALAFQGTHNNLGGRSTTDAHPSGAISFTPDGIIAATDVQTAIVELSTDLNTPDYLVGTASSSLAAEIVVGTSPGGELGGSWSSPTVDATHAGSTHLTLGTSPSTQASGDSAAGGSASDAAKTDHKHGFPNLITIGGPWSKEGNLTTGTGTVRWYNRTGRTLTFVDATAAVGTAPTTQSILIDVNVNGTTCFVASSQANRPTITATTNVGNTTTFDSIATITAGQYLTVDIDQVGSGTVGADLGITVTMKG